MTEEERIFGGGLFSPGMPELTEMKLKAHRLSREYNALDEEDVRGRERILREMLDSIGEESYITGPVYFHYGCHTRIGRCFFAAFHLTVQDDARVTIGDHCSFGPNVTIVTPLHPMRSDERRSIRCRDGQERHVCYARPVVIGNDCWFGANVVVCPGVTVGDNCVIGAGSVVTRSIPADSFAAGVPCRVIRPITKDDTLCSMFPEWR